MTGIIGLIGAPGTGKTTLGRAAAEALGLPFVQEAAIDAAEAGWAIGPEGLNLVTQLHIQRVMLAKEREAFAAGVGIVDCTTVGCAAHALSIPDLGEDPRAAAAAEAFLVELCRSVLPRYTACFYLPIEFPLDPGDRTPERLALQTSVDQRIQRLLSAVGVTLPALTGPVPERLDRLRAYLGNASGVTG